MCIIKWFNRFFPAAVPPPEPDSDELIALKKKQYKAKMDECEREADEHNKNHRKWADDYNNQCPKCGTKKVVDNIRRIQGEINGSMGGSLFGFGGSLHGSLDTNEVNQCTNPECGNQWKKSTYSYETSDDVVRMQLYYINWAIEHTEKVAKVTYDPNDITSKYNSLEEVRNEEQKRANDYVRHARENWMNTSIEVILEIAKNTSRWQYSSEKMGDEIFNKKKMKSIIGLKYAKEFLPKTQ